MLAELQQKKLKSTVTTERRRRVKVDANSGEQVVETYLMRVDVRTGEELGEVVDESGKAAAAQEYGGHLKKFRSFDASTGRWVVAEVSEEAPRSPPPDEAAAPDPAATAAARAQEKYVHGVAGLEAAQAALLLGEEAAAPPRSTADVAELTMVTYNIWFGPRTEEEAAKFGISGLPEPLESRRRRTVSLVAQLREEDPDIVCLQEVQEGERFLDILLADEWIRGKYRVAHAVRGAQLAYGLAALVSNDKFPSTVSCQVHDFTGFTVHNRIVMFLELPLGSAGSLRIANTHLDSLGEAGNRRRQLDYIVGQLSKLAGGDLVIAGDMNMTESSEESAWFSAREHGFIDLGAEAGPTMEVDDHTGQPERIDRLFHRPARLQVAGGAARAVGQSVADLSARPSDHFGISVRFGVAAA